MMTLTISAPDNTFKQTVESLCFCGGYSGNADDDAAKLEFAKEQLITLLGDKNREYAQRQIRQAAAAAVEVQINQAHAAIAATRESIVVTVG